jgi:RNA polymerase sigma factor (sigma-70 family)
MTKNLSEAYERNAAFWAQAYENHFKRLCALARRLLTDGNPAEAEDVVSEAFLRAMRYVKNPEAIANLFGYLWVTVKRVLIVKRRKENFANIDSLENLLSTGREPIVDPQVLRIMENKEFEDAMAVGRGPLTSRERRLLDLHLEGYNCDEIASILGEDVRLVRYDLNAVRAKVRYRLKQAKTKSKD